MANGNFTIDFSKFAISKEGLLNILAYVYLSALIIVGIFFGFSLPLFILFLLIAAFLLMPSTLRSLGVIIILTMLFERFFTLQPLIIDQEIYKIYPLDIIIGLFIISWLLIFFREKTKKPKIFFGWPEILLIVFIFLNLLYLFFGSRDINADFGVAFSTFKNYAFYPILYFLTVYSIQKKEDLKKISHLFLWGGVFIIAFVIIGLVRGNGLWTEFTPLSTGGVRILASTHAYYLVLSTILAVVLLSYNRFKYKGYIGIALWIWILGILGSLMRHLWLAVAASAVGLFVLIKKKNKRFLQNYILKNGLIILTVVIILVLLINLFPYDDIWGGLYTSSRYFQERASSLSTSAGDTSINWRVVFWSEALKSWASSPILGLGFGKKIPLEFADWKIFEEIRNIHNSLLAILIQMGILGLGIFIMLILLILKKSWQHIYKDKELEPYYIGIVVCLGVILFVSLFQPYLETNLQGIFFWIMLGLLRTSKIINRDNKKKIP